MGFWLNGDEVVVKVLITDSILYLSDVFRHVDEDIVLPNLLKKT